MNKTKNWDEVMVGSLPTEKALSNRMGKKSMRSPKWADTLYLIPLIKERVMSGLVKNGTHWEGMGDDNNGLFQCNLISFLKTNNLLPKDLAEILGLSASYISMICNGQKIPPPIRLWTISRIVNIGIERIWVFNDRMVPELLELAKLQSQENKIQARKKEIACELNRKIASWKNEQAHFAS